MNDIGLIGLLLIITNLLFTYKGLSDKVFFDKYKFEVDEILLNKDYIRLLSSGFLHVNWSHFIFNMYSLYSFSNMIESNLSEGGFLLIYSVSLLGGNLFSLFIHRNHGDYSAVGASGAISGIIFASIALFPSMSIGFLIIPIGIPGWLFGILYILISIYGIKSKTDNIGHEAHLGGAIVGMLTSLALRPTAFMDNYLTILAILLPTIAFIYIIVTRPHVLLVDNLFFNTHRKLYDIDQKYNFEKVTEQKEIDSILEKISKKGIDSLSKNEKKALDGYSQKLR